MFIFGRIHPNLLNPRKIQVLRDHAKDSTYDQSAYQGEYQEFYDCTFYLRFCWHITSATNVLFLRVFLKLYFTTFPNHVPGISMIKWSRSDVKSDRVF